MDSVRYYLALILLVILPPMILFWIVVHPLIHFWRRLGPSRTYALVGTPIVVLMVPIFQHRDRLLSIEYGTNYWLLALGVLCLIAASRMRQLQHRHMPNRVLVGLPELAPQRYPVRLVTGGPYARVRHPRYVEFALAIFAFCLMANYLTLYLVCALWVAAIYFIVLLEERELVERFGEEYEVYRRRVPRFAPRFKGED